MEPSTESHLPEQPLHGNGVLPAPAPQRAAVDRSDADLLLYEIVAHRRMQYDGMMWQVPALSLTAQAFLLTIAVGPDSSPVARVVSGLLSAVIALISVQLMTKHRRHESVDSRWLEKFERDRGLEPVHAPPRGRAEALGLRRATWLERLSSFDVWRFGLVAFGVIALFAAVATLIHPDVFG